jgi:hypothetical protein
MSDREPTQTPGRSDDVNGVDRAALLTALTTEHFGLQGARGVTVSESSSRLALYFGALSASLVTLGFVAQASASGTTFRVFALVVLPTLFALGLLVFVRLVETTLEDLRYGRAINRIRNYYLRLAGPETRYFMLGAHDDPAGVLRNMGFEPNMFQLYLTSGAAIAVVNSVVGGTTLALTIAWAFDPSLALAAALGGATAIVSLAIHMRWLRHRLERGHLREESLFPTPATLGGRPMR